MVKNTIDPLLRVAAQLCGKYCYHGNSKVYQLVCDKQLSISSNLNNGFESAVNVYFSYGKKEYQKRKLNQSNALYNETLVPG